MTANRGEWSEFYVMVKLFVEKGFYGVDAELNDIKDLYYSVFQIIGERDVIYELSTPDKVIIANEEGSKVVDIKTIQKSVDLVLDRIQNSSSTTFEIPEVEELMNELMCTKIKSGSSKKGDIKLVFEDPKARQVFTDYFSIKSFLAGKPTLLNASNHTKFTYRVTNLSEEEIDEINNLYNSRGSIDLTARIQKVYEYGGSLEFEGTKSPTMYKNLRKIDSLFPDYVSSMLLRSYLDKEKQVIKLIEDKSLEDIERKMGEFLEAVLKGMMPSIEWDLLNVAKGLLLVVNEGRVVGFHLQNKRELIEFLLKDSYLDTPSTSRHKIGKIYQSKGEFFVDLSLQIRLK
jgi:type II restriction enzyme